MADYKLKQDGGVIFVPSGAHIPNNPSNVNWQMFEEWKKLPGNIPDPVDPPTKRSPAEIDVIKRALMNKGIINPAELNNARTQLKDELI